MGSLTAPGGCSLDLDRVASRAVPWCTLLVPSEGLHAGVETHAKKRAAALADPSGGGQVKKFALEVSGPRLGSAA